MGTRPINHHVLTASNKAGLIGLWRASEKANGMALAWKFLEDLAAEEVGVNEVEGLAWKRAANRAVKKGAEWPKKKGSYDEVIR